MNIGRGFLHECKNEHKKLKIRGKNFLFSPI